MIFPNKKFQIILADPPWQWKTGSKKKIPKYNLMKLKDIKNLPVKDISDKNCILFIWITFPLLPEALEVIKSWGFKYKTLGFNWIKKNKKNTDTNFWGLGYYTRSNSEICLIATKGKIKRLSAKVHSVIESPIREHSRKPDIIKDKIVELVGDLPRIELFSRTNTVGWEVWGNEIGTL